MIDSMRAKEYTHTMRPGKLGLANWQTTLIFQGNNAPSLADPGASTEASSCSSLMTSSAPSTASSSLSASTRRLEAFGAAAAGFFAADLVALFEPEDACVTLNFGVPVGVTSAAAGRFLLASLEAGAATLGCAGGGEAAEGVTVASEVEAVGEATGFVDGAF